MADIEIPQLTYRTEPLAAYPGQLADLSAKQCDTGVCDVAMDCGRGLVYGSAYSHVKLPTSAGDITNHFQGFGLYQAIKEPVPSTAARFKIKDSINVLRKGRIWIPCEGNTTDDTPCFVVHTNADATKVGMVRADLDTNKAAQAPGCRIIRGANAGGLALVEVNLV